MRPFAILLFVALAVLAVNGGGYEDFLCTKTPGKRVFFPCDIDCINNHGATGGKCGDVQNGDFNCYCEGVSPTGGMDKSNHCKEPNDDFRNVCTFDCLCGHAATGGYCDWERKACICTDVGKNVHNVNCPAPNNREFGKVVYNYLGPKGLGEYGMGVIFSIIKNQTLAY